MFYVIHVRDKNDWIWIKKKKEAILAAQLLFRCHDVTLESSDGFGNYEKIPFTNGVQLSFFDPTFEEAFEKYVYSDGFANFYAFRSRK